jgi:cytochrome c-type biogenesis protein CcmH
VAAAAAWVAWPTGPVAPASDPRAAAGRPGAQVVGRVELDAATSAPRWPADAQVVIYAFALDGPRLPLAVLRRPASALPLDFKLDDSMAPNPAYRLSQAPQLIVGARLGAGDGVATQPGDWTAAVPVTLGSHGVRLVLQPVPR